MPASNRTGLAHGDRAVFLGRIGPRGRHCDILKAFGTHANVRFDGGRAMLVLAADLHPIPRRPPDMW